MRRLYFRIYLAVLASLIVFALAAGLLWHLLGESGAVWQGGELVARFAQNILPPASTDKADQQVALERITAGLQADVSLFAPDRSLLARVGAPLAAPEENFQHGMSAPRMKHSPAWTVRLPDGRWLVLRRAASERALHRVETPEQGEQVALRLAVAGGLLDAPLAACDRVVHVCRAE